MTSLEFISYSPQETIALGRRLGSQLKGGEVIGICGLLGSGKTHLIKGIAAGAGAEDSKQVNSPSFVIVNEYSGRPEYSLTMTNVGLLTCLLSSAPAPAAMPFIKCVLPLPNSPQIPITSPPFNCEPSLRPNAIVSCGAFEIISKPIHKSFIGN